MYQFFAFFSNMWAWHFNRLFYDIILENWRVEMDVRHQIPNLHHLFR